MKMTLRSDEKQENEQKRVCCTIPFHCYNCKIHLHLKQIMRATQDQMTQILNAESNVAFVSIVGTLDLTLFDSLVRG